MIMSASIRSLPPYLRRRSLLTGGLALSTVVAVPFSPSNAADPRPSGTLVVGTSLEPRRLNINYDPDNAAQYLNLNIYSKLLAFDIVGNTLYPELAESWDVAPNLSTYTFHLRRGVTWHDGKPFTAADVKWSIEDVLRQGTKAVTYRLAADIDHVDTPDDFTAVIVLKKPNGIMLENLASYYGLNILPRHVFEGTDPHTSDLTLRPVGTGPFRFVEHVPGSHLLMEANRSYFGDGPHLERLVFQFIPSLPTAMLALQAGEIGYATASPPFADVARLQALPGIKVESSPSPIVMWFGFNLDRPLWQDVRVRRAIAHAVNRDEIVDRLYRGLVKPADGYFTSAVAWANDPQSRQPAFDPAAAERLLDEAGHRRGPDGVRLKIRFVAFPTNIWGSVEQAQMVQQQLSRVGIAVEVQSVEFALRNQIIRGARDFDLVHSGGMRGPDPSELRYFVGSNGNYNTMNYRNPKIDTLLDEAEATADRAQRKARYFEVQALLAQDVPMVNLIEYAYLRPHRANYAGFFWQPEAAGKISDSMYNLVHQAS
jgi:peptide/nickel transport system substrate-binding protein